MTCKGHKDAHRHSHSTLQKNQSGHTCSMGVREWRNKPPTNCREVTSVQSQLDSQDPWVMNSVQGYTKDLLEQPIKEQAPRELNFTPGGERCPYSRGAGIAREARSLSSPTGASSQRFQLPTIPHSQKGRGERPVRDPGGRTRSFCWVHNDHVHWF